MAHVGLASAAWWGGREIGALIDAKSDLVEGTIVTASVTALAFVTGWLAGSLFFATYLLRMSRNNGAHTEEVFSSMAIADYKNFLRMHIDAQGELTIHAIGVKKIPHDWEFEKVELDQCGKPWFSSKKFLRFPGYSPHLIETITNGRRG